MVLRPHPHILEINARNWVWTLSHKYGREMTLGTIPEQEWNKLQRQGFDLIWLMGVWKISHLGRRTKAFHPALQAEYEKVLPDWTADDVIGSPFAIGDYRVNEKLGSEDDLLIVKERLHQRNMGLVLDFVPNHLAFDHPWTRERPHLFIGTSAEVTHDNEHLFYSIETSSGTISLAHGKDPFFPSWTDTAQLNYFNQETRQEMIAVVHQIAKYADGIRCDMAMLCLNDVIRQTWGWLLQHTHASVPETEFWSDLIDDVKGRNRNFLFIGEVYWDLEWKMQQLGFDFTYDKRLYDRMSDAFAQDIREHLKAGSRFQKSSLRFIENHDEERAITHFGPEKVKPVTVTIATIMGMRFFHEGQAEGKTLRLPVQLLRTIEEPVNVELKEFTEKILNVTNRSIFHDGDWLLLEMSSSWPGNDSHSNLIAWQWRSETQHFIIVVNFGTERSQGRLHIPECIFCDQKVVMYDHVSGNYFSSVGNEVDSEGLFIELGPYHSHILELEVFPLDEQ